MCKNPDKYCRIPTRARDVPSKKTDQSWPLAWELFSPRHHDCGWLYRESYLQITAQRLLLIMTDRAALSHSAHKVEQRRIHTFYSARGILTAAEPDVREYVWGRRPPNLATDPRPELILTEMYKRVYLPAVMSPIAPYALPRVTPSFI